jgi:tight adherence protein B
MLREQRLGASFEAALAGLERRVPLEETLLLCAALRISRHTGGHLAQTLEALADALRRKIALEGKIRSLTAQGRLQGWAMGLLPAVCALALALIEPEAMAMLVTTPLGWVTCAVLLLMQALGIHGLRRIVSIDP